jgi:hypothetical protein
MQHDVSIGRVEAILEESNSHADNLREVNAVLNGTGDLENFDEDELDAELNSLVRQRAAPHLERTPHPAR